MPVLPISACAWFRAESSTHLDWSLVRRCPSALHTVHQPGRRNDEQRRQHEAEQRIQPDERDVECSEAEADPERAQRTMRFQVRLPLRLWQEDRVTRYADKGVAERRRG